MKVETMSLTYQLQARRKDRTDEAAWFDLEEIAPLPSDQAARAVFDLNANDQVFVTRAVLVRGVEPAPAAAAVLELPVRVGGVISDAEKAMLRMWLPLHIESLHAVVERSHRWEIWRPQLEAARSLFQKIS